jgi:hypothetical protein
MNITEARAILANTKEDPFTQSRIRNAYDIFLDYKRPQPVISINEGVMTGPKFFDYISKEDVKELARNAWYLNDDDTWTIQK